MKKHGINREFRGLGGYILLFSSLRIETNWERMKCPDIFFPSYFLLFLLFLPFLLLLSCIIEEKGGERLD